MSKKHPQPEGPKGPERAALVSVQQRRPSSDDALAELELLSSSAGYALAGELSCVRARPDAATYIGSGKVDELNELVSATSADTIIFDNALSPIQQRNLEKALGKPVIDRTGLILEIFARRAQSAEGKMQVELARLEHLATRLVRGWTHLERQTGGIGVRGGPGEKQIELDRRMLDDKIKMLRTRLGKLGRQRMTQRRARGRTGAFRVALVGYTNAGKSTLFNALTKSKIYAADQLFATLDTTTRKLYLAPQVNVTLSDTVGFIRDLPHTLIEAFKATLEDTLQADLLLHVVDASSPHLGEQMDEVRAVLREIGADDIPQFLIYNKSDLLPMNLSVTNGHNEVEGIEVRASMPRFAVSALTGAGVASLKSALLEAVLADPRFQSSASALSDPTHISA
ncbi:GTPase HflX [Thiomonas bhubaneswarensis]|uniref:GTPase HflX n=1 Tax=Thiomonas bhubaneswarensis TaxID=339866 RepID=A0A0K6I1T4_9BURK|nr:GTP-binding protein HflX [Thiomonas bhubaneswarensis]